MTVDSFDSLNISENSISALRELLREMMVVTARMLRVDLAIAHSYREQELDKISEIYNKNDSNEDFSWLEATIIPITNLIAISELSSQVPSLQARGITASLIIPCQQQGELLAIFGFYHRQRQHSWTAEEIELAQTMAVATALSIAHLETSAIAYALAQREALLNTITTAIHASLEPQTLFKTITHQLGRVLNVDGCALSLWRTKDEFVQCVGLYDRFGDNLTLPRSLVPIAANPILQKLIATRQPVVLEELSPEEHLQSFDLPLQRRAKALLIVPLIIEDEIIGSISLRQTENRRQWTAREINLAIAIAEQAAIAVEQARLYNSTKRQAQFLHQKGKKVKELNQYLTESVLKRFLPASIVNKVATGELVLDLRPEQRQITVLFSDIVGFTPLSSQLGAKRVAMLLNDYLAAMTQAIFAQGGTVDKFMGDGIFALFGAPETLSLEEQAQKSIATARLMYRYLGELNQQWQEQGFIDGYSTFPVQFRCGIHQGNAVVGMFGGEQRLDYTAIGPAVNIASRLQEAADANTILVSRSIAHYLNSGEIIQVKSLKLKGIEEEMTTYAIKIAS
jgi:class 3 adenylate cyclase